MARKKVWNVFAKLRTAARQIWMWSPNRREILEAAKTGKGKKALYQCAVCHQNFPKYCMDVDHIEPCGEFSSYEMYANWCYKLFEGELRVLCKPCHLERK